MVGHLPVWVQWYMRPAGELTVFTLAVGRLRVRRRRRRRAARGRARRGGRTPGERRDSGRGAALVALGVYRPARPSIHAAASFWTSSPTWFAIRLGVLMLALGCFYGPEQPVGRRDKTAHGTLNRLVRGFALSWQTPLARLGRHSLFVYWIHVELVYGYSSWLWRHRLPLWGTAIAYVLFCVLMYRAIGWRDRFVTLARAAARRADLGAVELIAPRLVRLSPDTTYETTIPAGPSASRSDPRRSTA